MDPLSTMFSTASKVYNASTLAEQIGDIYQSISDVYSDIADAQFQTAQQAFAAASHSKSPEHEIVNAINSLRNAYNTYAKLIGKTRKERYLIFFTDNVPYIQDSEQFYKEMTKIAAIICWCYRTLGEENNAAPWHNSATSNFEKYLEYYYPSPHALYLVSPRYARKYTQEEEKSRHWMGDGMPDQVEYETVTDYEITDAGQEYVERRKRELIQQFPQILREKKVGFNFEPG